jgi:hypothetical protein
LVSADKGYTPLNLSDNIISDIVKPNIPDTIANIKQKSLHGRYFKELEQLEVNVQASHAWLKTGVSKLFNPRATLTPPLSSKGQGLAHYANIM